MARRKADRPAERSERGAETAAVAAYLTALRALKVPATSRAALVSGVPAALYRKCVL